MIEHDRHGGRALAFNEKVSSLVPHMVDVTEEISAAYEAVVLHY